MNRLQRLALSVAFAVALTAAAWAIVPFSVGASRCGSALTAAVAPDQEPQVSAGVSRRSGSDLLDPPCREPARDRLVACGVVMLVAVAFALGSQRILADPS